MSKGSFKFVNRTFCLYLKVNKLKAKNYIYFFEDFCQISLM